MAIEKLFEIDLSLKDLEKKKKWNKNINRNWLNNVCIFEYWFKSKLKRNLGYQTSIN